ncbi:CAP domain-containing protein [Microseira sp. BLCC-F43]|jgi:uncharacterized protein YkwD|uniref:CAP domain-containing protein n=1 Tax=Microseira sp. BLCC-F43 TaxID=3153602 RepID=UPI0035B77C6A
MRQIKLWAIALTTAFIPIEQFSLPFQPKNKTLPPDTRLLLAQSNYDGELLELTNAQRRRAGLAPLRYSPELGRSAQLHAEDMARNNFNLHTGSDGSNVGTRINRVGYQFSLVGENIYAESPNISAANAVGWWMRSPGHRRNILNSNFTEIGFGYSYDGRFHRMVQVFATPRSASNPNSFTSPPPNFSSSNSARTWNLPTIRGVPFDATVWESDTIPQSEQAAVQEGANLFCQSQGYSYATSWDVGKNERITIERGTFRFNRGNPNNPRYCNWCRWHLTSVSCNR